ncbi:MAG: hypothetical protein U0792_22200 [Gemmataceae bacterium]
MSRNSLVPAAFKLAILGCGLSACVALAAPQLPPLPPPGKTPPEKTPPPAKLPPPAKVAPAVPVTQIPVEFTIPIADLKKQMLRSIIQQLDPKADLTEPKLPLVVKPNLMGGAQNKQADAKNPVVIEDRKLPEPKKMMPELPPAPEKAPDGRAERAERSRLLKSRQPGSRPILERIAERPLIANAAKMAVERFAETSNTDVRIELRSFDLVIVGNTLTCEVGGGVHCEDKVPPGAPPTGVRDIGIKLRVSKDLVWNENGKLEPKEGASRVWIDPDAPVIGFPRLDLPRILQINGLLGLLSGVVDRELMKRMPADKLPDLAKIGPELKEKVPFLAVQEITVYPLVGNEQDLRVPLVIGFVPMNKKTGDEVTVSVKQGKPPEPKFRGTISFDKDGKPIIKLDPAR